MSECSRITGIVALSGFAAGAVLLGLTAAPALAQGASQVLELDFPELHIGVAEDDDGPTGTTVFYFPAGVIAASDVRGGSPGTVNATATFQGYEEPFIDAVVFSGGSWYGLSAATGVADAIGESERAAGRDHIAGVLGAIIYDLGARRFSRVTPDHALGAAALRSARPNRFPLGARGAGRMAMQGVYYAGGRGVDGMAAWPHSGQGGAFRQVGPTKVAVFTVVNALGAVVDREGRVVRCHRNDPKVRCPPVSELIRSTLAERGVGPEARDGPTDNTTLTLVVTNQKMPFADLERLAIQVHTSMGRAIQPFATDADGDLLYAVTTAQVENPELSSTDLAVLASEVAWDAVLSSVPGVPAPPSTEVAPVASDRLGRFAGAYELADGGRLALAVEDDTLIARFTRGRNEQNMYFAEDRAYRLQPAEDEQFVVDGPAGDVIRFDLRGGDEPVGLILNPGPWAIKARRLVGAR